MDQVAVIESHSWVLAAQGRSTNFASEVQGPLVEVSSPQEALAVLAQIDAGEVVMPIVLVHEAGGTTLGPLLGEIGGVVSTVGTMGSHIALLAKEYGCACIVGAQFTIEPKPAGSYGPVTARMTGAGEVWFDGSDQ